MTRFYRHAAFDLLSSDGFVSPFKGHKCNLTYAVLNASMSCSSEYMSTHVCGHTRTVLHYDTHSEERWRCGCGEATTVVETPISLACRCI